MFIIFPGKEQTMAEPIILIYPASTEEINPGLQHCGQKGMFIEFTGRKPCIINDNYRDLCPSGTFDCICIRIISDKGTAGCRDFSILYRFNYRLEIRAPARCQHRNPFLHFSLLCDPIIMAYYA